MKRRRANRRDFARSLSAASLLATILAVLALLAGGELYLRSTGKFADYLEKNGVPEGQVPANLREPWVFTFERSSERLLKKAEYTQEEKLNAEGLPGALPPPRKAPGEYRIIAVGDSSTEGVGDTSGREGYVGRLRSSLSVSSVRKYVVMNAGVAGGDPIFYVELIRRKLLKYHPDLVLMTINRTDIDDVSLRGGQERFTADGMLKIRPRRFWQRSHLVRALLIGWLGYDWSFRSPREVKEDNRRAVTELISAAENAKRLASEAGFRLLILVHPQWSELRRRGYSPELAEVVKGLQARGIPFADLLPGFLAELPAELPKDCFWPLDGHFTAKGYDLFARTVEKALKPVLAGASSTARR